MKVIKHEKFLQAIFYLLGYEKDQITEPGTQKFLWKKAKSLIDEKFIEKMSEYG